ncbi:hypothetical protein SAMN04489707_102747 [Paenacidovorax caeni]|uniref:DUF3102 domain-containing protein n=1 Tax=Paenacidovorax caeni TaxID=343013 RepID=A0A1I7JKR1_9BURK|nr:hypothetical protein [Paenacidovorax caeni]SFU85718.1 hypothetical protein SAMN04489707_102747 [Paenacidovorax caeni]
MARPPKTIEVQDVDDKTIDQEKFADAMTLMRADEAAQALALSQRETTVRAVAQQLGYQLPADATDPDLIQRDIAANMRRSVEACLEVGRGLRVLKEACEHGSFIARLDVLGIEERVARRFMQSAIKFTKRATSPVLTAAGSQSKLFEMLVLDDEQIEELELTGQTGELSLDDVATMSVKELRAALRETRAEHDATKAVMSKKQARIDQLERAQERIAKLPPDEELARLQQEATTHLLAAQGAIRGQLRAALVALQNHQEDNGTFMAGMVGQLMADLTLLRDEFNLPSLADGAQPEWQRWATAQGAGAAQAN